MSPFSGTPLAAGTHTVTTAEATATTCAITTGLPGAALAHVIAIRAGKVVASDLAVSLATTGVLTVAAGSSYVLTAGDVLHWLVA